MTTILDIIHKYLNNTATLSEIERLEKWVRDSPENAAVFKDHVFLHERNQNKKQNFDQKIAFKKFLLDTEKRKSAGSKYKYAAAAALLIAALSITFLNKDKTVEPSQREMTETTALEEAIILTLEDGTKKILKENGSELILSVTGDTLQQQQNNTLKYVSNTKNAGKTHYHKLQIPLGKTFKINLSDGTTVWLNAGSSLYFPVKFNRNEPYRKVVLEGEAFFEVTKNSRQPFIVNTSGVDVQVLGTKFNVSSYGDDENIKTTLVEGSVQIFDQNNKDNNSIIQPNEQLVFEKSSGALVTKEVNVDKYIAWIHNRLYFENDQFSEIVKKIERSYDVDIENNYEGLNSIRFTGEFDIEDVNDVFATFTANTPFSYKIENNKISINQK